MGDPQDFPRLLPVLVRIQSELDRELSLDTLAATAGLSRHHFHRLFSRQIGETPKRYTSRLRLERAAVRLLLHRGSVLEIALDCGFQSHETFTRAFGRQFGVPPRVYRREGSRRPPPPTTEPRTQLSHPQRQYRLSSTKVQTLEEMHLAFLRHLGPYENVGDHLWAELADWAEQKQIPGKPVLLGLAQDPPGITPDDKLRFDAAIRVPGPFPGEGAIGYQVLPSKTFAVTTHVGHYRSLPQAYGEIVGRVSQLRSYQLSGLPTVEIYHTSQVNADYDLNHTDIYLPVARGSSSP